MEIASNSTEIDQSQSNVKRCKATPHLLRLSQNQLGEEKFHVDQIMEELRIKSDKGIVYEVSKLFREGKREMIEMIFQKLEKGLFLALVEKALKINNEGGVKMTIFRKGTETIITKTTGGIFFSLIKKEGGLNSKELKDIFTADKKMRKERERIIKNMDKLLI
jgi:hypothetical protein